MSVHCPNCLAPGMQPFYDSPGIPVHSCMMLDTRAAALDFPQGDLTLGFCKACGFVSNICFDGALQHYAAGYEEQQSFSPRFRAFQTALIDDLIERYDLRGKDVVEIGCGKGDFLIELCRRGGNRGVGIDPACDPARMDQAAGHQVRFVAELYGPAHAELPCDFLCCRHTLEHIHPTFEFVAHLRRVVGARRDCVVCFEVPDVERVLRERAFWDIYYEHCSYFSLGSLARVFRRNAFAIDELYKDFDDQYLLLVARPTDAPTEPQLAAEQDLLSLSADVEAFTTDVSRRIDALRRQIQGLRAAGKRVAIWGSGSKCVSFLSTVGVRDDIAAVIDINPFRHGKFLAGSGQEVVAPESLIDQPVDAIFVMNPIYTGEIQAQLDQMGVSADLYPV